MRVKRKGLSFGSIFTLLLTCLVLAGCGMVFRTFHSDADIQMQALQMVGLLSDTFSKPETRNVPANGRMAYQPVTARPPVQPGPTHTPIVNRAAQPQPSGQVTLTLAGLAAFESGVADAVYDKQSTACNFQPVLQDIASENVGDIRIVALPMALCGSAKNYTDVNAQPGAALALSAAGFNAVAVEACKALESSAQTAVDTANVLYNNGMDVVGVEAGYGQQVRLVDKNGVKLALIGYCEQISTKAANTLQSSAGQGMLPLDTLEELEAAIQQARSQGAQCVVVYHYWRDTDVKEITDAMRKKALELTAAGADIIAGVGIKRMLPASWLNTSDENGLSRRALVLYSMGSLITESREAYDIAGALVHITIKPQWGEWQIVDLSYTPTYIWKQQVNGKEQYRVVRSDQQPPAQMNEKQQGVMKRSLIRTRESMQDLSILSLEE